VSSSGTFLAWLDSDDEWVPQKIADQMVAFDKNPDADVVFTRCQPIDEFGNPPLAQSPLPTNDAEIRTDILRMMVVESEVMPSSSVLRRAAFDLVGGYDVNYRFSEDWHLDFRLAQQSNFAYLDTPLTRYRIHNESKTKDRWPHALGRIKLRHFIDASRDELLARDSSPEMVRALDRHRVKYADAYYRIGKLSLEKGDIASAQKALRQARSLNPKIVKYYTRGLRAELTALFSPKSVSSKSLNNEVEWCRK